MVQIRIQDAAVRELERLDPVMVHRIANRIRWLAANLAEIKPESLTASLSGFYKLRVGDYRIVYEILRSEQIIVIHMIGHRKEIYRKQ